MKKLYTIKLVIIIELAILLSSCAKSNYSNKPTLKETQEMYHDQKHGMQNKRIPKAIFWYSTIFIFSYMYVSAMKK